jgi:hypothetical protein
MYCAFSSSLVALYVAAMHAHCFEDPMTITVPWIPRCGIFATRVASLAEPELVFPIIDNQFSHTMHNAEIQLCPT